MAAAPSCAQRPANVPPSGDPGFATELPLSGRHTIRISVFSANADTITTVRHAEAPPGTDRPILQLA
jgi:hypothetical protein